MPTVSTPLRYPGGKSALTDFLAKTIELNGLSNCTYIEPFCGGAGAAINLLVRGCAKRLILNDIDPMIYSFWFSILNYTDEFVTLIEQVNISIEEWRKQKKISVSKSASMLERGFSAFFLNRCNRSGILKANPIGGLKQDGKWGIDARFNKESLIKKIIKIAEYKDSIIVENRSVFSFLSEVVFNLTEEKFIYLDPPYYEQGPGLYLNALSSVDHENLAKILLDEKECIWLATYDNAPQIKEMYRNITVKTFSLNYSAHTHKKGKELLIYPSQTVVHDADIKPTYSSLPEQYSSF